MSLTRPESYVEEWYWRFFNLSDEDKIEMLEHMKVEPIYIISYSLFFKIIYYPLFWIRQYKITCKYWSKPVKFRWFWRIYYTTDWCNLMIWPKGGVTRR